MHVTPTSADDGARAGALVLFLEGETPASGETAPADRRQQAVRRWRACAELAVAQSQLVSASRKEHEFATQELRAANEELQSINEEYRSTAEELETSKEELQSMNEELQTVNSELKNEARDDFPSHNDLQNLMATTEIGTLFLDPKLASTASPRASPSCSISRRGDEGRSITDFTHGLDYEGLAKDARTVLADLASIEREMRSRTGGEGDATRSRPYRTVQDRIDGVVVTFVDIGERRRAEDALRDSEARMRAIINGVAVAIVTIDEHGNDPVDQCGDDDGCSAIPPDELDRAKRQRRLRPEPDRSQHDD